MLLLFLLKREPDALIFFLLLSEHLLHGHTFLGSKLFSLFLRLSHPLLRLFGLLNHVIHPLVHHFVLLLLTLERIRLVGLNRLNQGHHCLLHFLLVVQQRLEHL